MLSAALSERVRKGAKSEEGTHSEYIFELRKPFIVYGIPELNKTTIYRRINYMLGEHYYR